jgi:hypothetical protein
MMSNISNEEIIRMALQREIDTANVNSIGPPESMAAFKAALDRFDQTDFATMFLAAKLLEGKSYLITSDNSETISRAKSIAIDIGAAFEVIHEGHGVTQIRFEPPPRQ